MAGAPLGNTNAARGKPWREAIQRALETRTKSRFDGKRELDALAEKLLDLVAQGDLGALKEFGDRLEGKPSQDVAVVASVSHEYDSALLGLLNGSAVETRDASSVTDITH